MHIGIIGGGPAGYVAAIRAAQLGARVTVVEKEALGGVCTNHGCIPTKTLYLAAKKMHDFHWGLSKKLWSGEIAHDWHKVIDFKNSVVMRLVRGIEFLFKKRGVQVVHGEARMLSPAEVEVEGTELARLKFDKLLIATGSMPTIPPVNGLAGISPWDNRKALAAGRVPESLLILGGGVVGVEFAHIFASFGSKVTIVELLPRILPFGDDEISALLHRALVSEGVKIIAPAKAVAAHRKQDGIVLEMEDGDVLFAEEIIVATGRRAVLPDGAESIGLTIEKNALSVNDYLRTEIDEVYAAGDVVGLPHLAHKASHQGIAAVENMMGAEKKSDARNVPSAIFSAIEIGTAGMCEKEAKEKFGDEVKVGKFPYIASGRAQCEGESQGFIKIVADGEGRIVGFHAAGRNASELLGLGGFLVQRGMPLSDIQQTIFAHPTMSEMVGEAALAADSSAIHIF